MTDHPLTIQTKRLPYAFRSLADKISDGVDQILMVEVTINDTTIDLGLLRGEDRRELAAHLRDVADELDPQEGEQLQDEAVNKFIENNSAALTELADS